MSPALIFVARLLATACMVSVMGTAPAIAKVAPTPAQGVKKSPTNKSAAKPARAVVRKPAMARVGVVRPRASSPVSANARRASAARFAAPPKPSFGQLAGLHATTDALSLRSSSVLVMDQDTNEVLFSKNDGAVLPIASITKLMTALIVSEANLPMDEVITITQDDVDTEKGSRSRLRVGTRLTRGELLHLALMSSENRAAHALGRTHPGGLTNFVRLMNAKAALIGMKDSRYVEPTGLSSRNQSSAQDLALLVNETSKDARIRALSTSTGHQVAVGHRTLQFNNTNRLVSNPQWDIGLQKTGYISEAGQCLVMQTKVGGRKLIMVFLDSVGKYSRLGDAERVRRWVEDHPGTGGNGLTPSVKHVSG